MALPNNKQAGTVPLVRFSACPATAEKLLIFQSVDYVHVVDLGLNARQTIHLPDHLPFCAVVEDPSGLPAPGIQTFISGGDFSADGHSFYVGSSDGAETERGGFLWEFPLQAVPSLKDLVLSFIQGGFSNYWSRDRCARTLPPDLMSTLFP